MYYTTINSLNDVFTITGADPEVLIILNTLPEPARKPIIDNYLMELSIEAINMLPEDDSEKKLEAPWIPDLTDGTHKWHLWPDVVVDNTKPSGFGLASVGYVDTVSYSDCGSRRLFRSSGRARHFFRIFQYLLEAVYLIDKPKLINN